MKVCLDLNEIILNNFKIMIFVDMMYMYNSFIFYKKIF